jgi:hypothetical protein
MTAICQELSSDDLSPRIMRIDDVVDAEGPEPFAVFRVLHPGHRLGKVMNVTQEQFEQLLASNIIREGQPDPRQKWILNKDRG